MAWLTRPMDVDRWELVISPEEYLNRFKDSLADIQLINRAPLRKLHTTYHRGPAFDKYLLIAEATHQLWVDLRLKKPFFNALDVPHGCSGGDDSSTRPARARLHLPTSVFIDCLMAAGCHTIRLKSYGQKMPMTTPFLHNEPAQTDHRWAEHNEWDIGTTFVSPYIWLFASATGRRHGIKHFPMCVPGLWRLWLRQRASSLIVVASSQSRYTLVLSTSSSHSTATSRAQSQRTLSGVLESSRQVHNA